VQRQNNSLISSLKGQIELSKKRLNANAELLQSHDEAIKDRQNQ